MSTTAELDLTTLAQDTNLNDGLNPLAAPEDDDTKKDLESLELQDDEEVVVTIAGESPPQDEDQAPAPAWVQNLRKTHRELQKKNRELEDKLKAVVTPETKPVALSTKPTLADHDYNTEDYEAALTTWYDQKRKADEQQAKVEQEAKLAADAWTNKVQSYNKSKTELKVKDFEEAEAAVQDALSATQQGIIVQGAENPALLVYALGKNPKKAKELASITDPLKYAFAIAKLETQLKVTNRKAPPPEKTVVGSGRISGGSDAVLEKLRAEAEKTGDISKVIAYKKSKRATN